MYRRKPVEMVFLHQSAITAGNLTPSIGKKFEQQLAELIVYIPRIVHKLEVKLVWKLDHSVTGSLNTLQTDYLFLQAVPSSSEFLGMFLQNFVNQKNAQLGLVMYASTQLAVKKLN